MFSLVRKKAHSKIRELKAGLRARIKGTKQRSGSREGGNQFIQKLTGQCKELKCLSLGK